MAYTNDVLENYGVNPPEKSIPFWGKENPTEDDVVTSIDFQESLQKLSEEEREIIQLFNQGYLLREISANKNMPTTTVHRIKECAIKKLRKMLNGKDNLHSLFT